MVFPAYYFGQIAEARQQPGTVSYSGHMQLDLLQETTDEMARNGCKKIVIVNGHGGNLSLLPYFAQLQMQTPHDYVVYVYWRPEVKGADRPYKGGTVDMHAGESETAHTMVSAPGLVHTDRAKSESGADEARLHLPDGLYTGIWWYARFPNHYSGDGSLATKELGEYDVKAYVKTLADVIRAVKADSEAAEASAAVLRRCEASTGHEAVAAGQWPRVAQRRVFYTRADDTGEDDGFHYCLLRRRISGQSRAFRLWRLDRGRGRQANR